MYKISSYVFINNDLPNTILFLHGWGCNINYMFPLAKQIDFANSLIIDLPGFGKNKKFESPKTLKDYVDYILDFINEKQIKITLIVGHSFGGKIATLLADKLNVKSLILLAPSIYNCRRGLRYYTKIFVYKTIKKIKFLNKFLKYFGSKDYKALSPTMKKTMSNVINESVEHELQKLVIPLIVIFGKQDKITPIYLGKKIVKKAKDASLITIEGDHFAYLYNVTLVTKIIESMANQL